MSVVGNIMRNKKKRCNKNRTKDYAMGNFQFSFYDFGVQQDYQIHSVGSCEC